MVQAGQDAALQPAGFAFGQQRAIAKQRPGGADLEAVGARLLDRLMLRRTALMAGTAAAQLQKEQAQLAGAQQELGDLEASVERDVARLREEKEALAGQVTSFPVALERDDVRVEEVALLWIPDAG